MKNAIKLSKGPLQLEIWPLGARLNGGSYEGRPLVYGSMTREEALGPRKYNGAVVGPVANRIANGTIDINGTTNQLNRNENGITTLHGGADGVHALDWKVEAASKTKATLSLELKDGDGGFPGNRKLSAEYVIKDHAFTLSLSATTDAPTPINLALHPYWCLDTAHRDKLKIQVAAETYTPVDDAKIPTGQIAAVSDTIFDLRALAAISPDIDHNFCLIDGADPAVVLQGQKTKLDILTDAPGLQIYSGKNIGIAIEPQHWPDALNHANFPSILLLPGETYKQTSTYRFSTV